MTGGPAGRIVKRAGKVVPAIVLDAAGQAAKLRADAAAELERARRDAEVIRREAAALGREEGRDQGAAEMSEMLASARLEAKLAIDGAAEAALPLAVRMAERIVGAAIAVEPAHLVRIAQAALATSRARAGRVVLRVHPEDRRKLEESRPALTAALAAIDLAFVDDERVGRSGCIVETPSGRVDARLATQLAALERALAPRIKARAP